MSAETAPLLAARGIIRAFGGVTAVDVDHFEVGANQIVALIGPNGAGKTTFFNVLTGFERADAGAWTFDGQLLVGKASYWIARAGMVRTFQVPKVLAHMSVIENVKLAATHQRGERLRLAAVRPAWRAQERQIHDRACEVLEWVGLAAMRDDYAGTLSGGQAKLLELGRALMVEPKLLMLDEPTAGVSPTLTEQLLARLLELRDRGLTLVFVEHDMDVVARISDEVVCLAQGRVIARGTPREVAANDAVIEAYLGSRQDRAAQPPAR